MVRIAANGESYLNAKEAAQELGVCPNTICNFVRRKKFPKAFKIGRMIWIPMADIEQLRNTVEIYNKKA